MTPKKQFHTAYTESFIAAGLDISAQRKEAKAAGLAYFIAAMCGGGFTDHRRSAESGRCMDCKRVNRQAKRAALLTAPVPLQSPPHSLASPAPTE